MCNADIAGGVFDIDYDDTATAYVGTYCWTGPCQADNVNNGAAPRSEWLAWFSLHSMLVRTCFVKFVQATNTLQLLQMALRGPLPTYVHNALPADGTRLA